MKIACHPPEYLNHKMCNSYARDPTCKYCFKCCNELGLDCIKNGNELRMDKKNTKEYLENKRHIVFSIIKNNPGIRLDILLQKVTFTRAEVYKAIKKLKQSNKISSRLSLKDTRTPLFYPVE